MKKYSKIILIKVLIVTLFLTLTAYAKPPHGLYDNRASDAELIKKHIPFGIDMSKALLKCDKKLINRAYISYYSYQTNTPLWSSYTVTEKEASGRSKRYRSFLYDKRVPKKHRIKSSDYSKSGYDRGHLFPNALADGGSIVRQAQAFLMTNIAPQHPKLNRVGWKYLESAVRKWLKRHKTLNIITGVWFNKSPIYIGKRKQQKIAVPAYWYKIIYDPKEKKAIAFWMPNSPVNKREWFKYRTSIDDIEAKTKIDFFYNLPDDIENRMESDSTGRF